MLGFSPYSAAAFADIGTGEQLFIPTGVAANGAIGTVLVTGDQIGLLLGSVEGTASSNGVTVDGGATGTFTMDQLNGLVNGVTVDAGTTAAITGVGATGSVGDVTIVNVSVISPTGVEATGAVGAVTVTANQSGLTLTGVAGTMAVGTAAGQAGAGASVTGVFATGSVGSITMTGTALVIPTGVSGQGVIGNALVWGKIVPDPGTIWTRIAA